MWCSTCQLDVPGVAGEAGAVRCSQCSQPFAAAQATALNGSAAQRLLSDSPTEIDWALEAELRGVERLVGSLRNTAGPASAIDPPHPALPTWHAPSVPQPREPVVVRSTSHTAAWTILSIGLAIFACGGVLLGWSVVGQRDDLWPIGMPLALIGQAGLILGLILQLDGLWHTSRQATQALAELDGELASVRQATTLLSTSQTSGAQSFYVHLAEGASPQLLLADLKGQLDLLAQQMAAQRK
jgi:hypothetical protein